MSAGNLEYCKIMGDDEDEPSVMASNTVPQLTANQ